MIVRHYDSKSLDLAEHFLQDETRKAGDAHELALEIQQAVEDWFAQREVPEACLLPLSPAEYTKVRDRAIAGDDKAVRELGLSALAMLGVPPTTEADFGCTGCRSSPCICHELGNPR
jgi:hypothetical protein